MQTNTEAIIAKKRLGKFSILLSIMIGLFLIGVVPAGWAEDEEEMPFDEAHIFFELNNTDGIVNYEVVVEIDESPWKSSTILPSEATSFVVPQEILDLVDCGDEIKFEVLVREDRYNQKAVESCFVLIAP